jgi:protein TonB
VKKIYIFLLFFNINNYAQKNNLIDEVFPIFSVCKLLPDSKQEQCFSESLQEHIETNFLYPKSAWDLNLEAIVNVKFDIDENGKINNIKPNANLVGVTFIQQRALNNAKQVFEIAALKIMEELPLLTPAKVNNIPTKKTFQISIKYQIPKELSFEEVENAPVLKGCEEKTGKESKSCFENAIAEHISENFKYPRRAIKNKIEGDVFIQFSIDQYGYLIDFTTIGPERILEDEAYRIMSSLLVSKPATFNGKNVKITYGIPISFRLN